MVQIGEFMQGMKHAVADVKVTSQPTRQIDRHMSLPFCSAVYYTSGCCSGLSMWDSNSCLLYSIALAVVQGAAGDGIASLSR